MTYWSETWNDLNKKAGSGHRAAEMAGFTFIEILVSLMVLSILTAIFGMGLVAAMESYAFSRSNTDTAQKGQLAMQRISRELSELVEIRTVSSDPDYIIYSRVQHSDSAPPSKISMGIYYDGPDAALYLFSNIGDTATLTTDGDHSGKVLLDNVHDFSLAFYSGNEDWIFGSDPAKELSSVQITLSLARGDRADMQQTFTGLIYLRSIGNAGGAHLFE